VRLDRARLEQGERRGKVYSFSEVHHAALPAFAASVPYNRRLGALAEGVHLLTRFIKEPRADRDRRTGRLDFRVLESGQLLPGFLV